MINYDYICKSCGHELKNVLQSIKDDPLTHCDACGEESLSRVIFGGRAAFVENVSTIGQLADRNMKNMGHYKRSEIEEKHNSQEKKEAHAKKETRRKINNMTPEQKKRYIMEGK
tara:strand:+ start:2497 stop:2838 length:342 start_codon:yes stop_codon:yes gene_type:complete